MKTIIKTSIIIISIFIIGCKDAKKDEIASSAEIKASMVMTAELTAPPYVPIGVGRRKAKKTYCQYGNS